MYTHPFMPPVASEHGSAIDWTLALVHIFMLLLFVGWTGFFLLAIFRFRNSLARVSAENSAGLIMAPLRSS